MILSEPRLLPAGDSAILIEFADEIDDATNDRVHALAQYLRAQRRADILDLVPAYASLLVCYDSLQTDFATMRGHLAASLSLSQSHIEPEPRVIEIPVQYGGPFGPDLGFIAQWSGLPESQVVDLHASVLYRVYFVGFTPGFAYLGSVPEKIAAPRLGTPRTRVPSGSVGIAARQTGIYPADTPGGWRLIGRTDLDMFDVNHHPPARLRSGDRVRFVPC